ncbi:hypothetical protein AB4Y44_39320 [Paraburkholderia sp. BR10937]|uniref:hypothetical protein n=1 Tax=Paraburkholderia sp. BR10937 TaxID=3236994 RepID=UPI0034D27109
MRQRVRAPTLRPHHGHYRDRAARQREHGRIQRELAPARRLTGLRESEAGGVGDGAAKAAKRVDQEEHDAETGESGRMKLVACHNIDYAIKSQHTLQRINQLLFLHADRNDRGDRDLLPDLSA